MYVASMPLGRLLAIVERAVEEGEALRFSLVRGRDGNFTELLCNGLCCSFKSTTPVPGPVEVPSFSTQSGVIVPEADESNTPSCIQVWKNSCKFLIPSGEFGMGKPPEDDPEVWVHKAIHVAPRFRSRLAGPDESFLNYLRCHYAVLVFLENSKKKLHIKGLKKNALECNLYVRELLDKWRRDETVTE